MVIEDHIEIGDPLIKEDIPMEVGDALTKEDTLMEEDSLMEEDPLKEDILMEMGDPLEEEVPLMEEDPLDLLVDKDHQALKDPWTHETYNSPDPSSDAGYNCFGKILSTLLGSLHYKLARAQDQTNRQLQQHIQQGQVNMQAHTRALQQLATSTYQRNFDHIFASIPIYDRSNREGFIPWLECLEVACFYSGRNIKTKALGRSAGPVQNVIIARPNAKSWRPIREELKRCFSDQTSLRHEASQLENMTQKPNEPLRLYIFRYTKIHKSVTKRDVYYNTDYSRWFRFLTSITNTTIADKIARMRSCLKLFSNVLRRLLDWRLASNCLRESIWPEG